MRFGFTGTLQPQVTASSGFAPFETIGRHLEPIKIARVLTAIGLDAASVSLRMRLAHEPPYRHIHKRKFHFYAFWLLSRFKFLRFD